MTDATRQTHPASAAALRCVGLPAGKLQGETSMSQLPQPSNTPADETTKLRATFAELRKLQAVGRTQLWCMAFAVIAIFGGFALTTYQKTQQNFSQENITAAATAAVPDLTPALSEELTRIAQAVLPVYKQTAIERIAVVGPQVSAAAIVRLERLPADAGQLMGDRLIETFDRVIQRIEPEVNATFPSLTDATRRDLLTAHFFNVVEQKNQDIATHINTTFTNELIRLHAILDKFYVPESLTQAQTDELQRKFLASLLGLAQYELEVQPASPVTADIAR
jgi:hypothetical protein